MVHVGSALESFHARYLGWKHYRNPAGAAAYDAALDGVTESNVARQFSSPQHALHLYARGVRSGRVELAARRFLLENVSSDEFRGNKRDLFEYCLFLFSEKDWSSLADILIDSDFATMLRGDAAQAAMMGDLAFLSAHRLRQKGKADLARLANAAGNWKQVIGQDQRRVHEACIAFLDGEIEWGRGLIQQSVLQYRPHFALSGLRTVFDFQPDAAPAPSGGIDLIRRSSKRVVLLVSVDKSYFDLFAMRFQQTAFRASSSVGVHFHCIGFTPDTAAMPEECGFSAERFGGNTVVRASDDALRKRAYYAVARYIHLEHFLGLYDAVRVSDVDGEVYPRAGDAITHPVILHSFVERNLGLRLPTEMVSAGNVSLRACEKGTAFAAYVRQYILQGFASGLDPLWYLDQSALFSAWADLKDSGSVMTDMRPFFTQKGDWSLAKGLSDKLEGVTKNAGAASSY